MKQREAVANGQSENLVEETPNPNPLPQEQPKLVHPQLRSPSVVKRRAWTWDDSLRSNSDRFLETLEEDLPAAAPGGRTSLILHRRTPLHVTFVEGEEEEHAEREEHPEQDRVAVQGR